MFLKRCLRGSKTLLVSQLCLLMATGAMAQDSKQVRGRVLDSTGQPIVGAAVVVDGTTTGTVTDIDGNYTLTVPDGSTLTVSFIGYDKASQPVSGEVMNFTLNEEFNELDELVVVGYGVQKKSDVTGALVRVDAETLNQRPVANAFEALQGKAAGVDITSNQRPGEVGKIRIRGNRSLNASNEPLYVVDGVPLSAGGIESINPRDIESVDILKDASSTAIYGSRGANGVVLITTKHGHEGQMKVNYSGSWTIESIKDLAPAMSASDYITWARWAYHNATPDKYNAGDNPDYDQDQVIFNTGDPSALANVNRGWSADHKTWDGSKVINTDWCDMVTQKGLTQEHTLSASGGTEKLQAFASFGYLKNEGTQKGQEYERFNGALSLDLRAKDWFKMGGTANFSKSTQKYGWSRSSYTLSGSGPVDIYSAAKALMTYTVPYDAAGDLITAPGNISGVYTIVDEWNKTIDDREVFRTLASIYGQIDFGGFTDVLEGLSYKISFGPDFRYSRTGVFTDASSAGIGGGKNKVSRDDERKFSWTLDNMITYNKKIAEVHNVGLTLLQSASKYNKESSKMGARGIDMPSFKWNNIGGGIDIADNNKYSPSLGTDLSENTMTSYMARLNYSFKDRYLLTVSGRWDGASVLAEGNKWDFFPSAAIGWRIDQEDFMYDLDWLDQLKLRVGLGATGNSSVSAYGTLNTIQGSIMPFSTGNTRILITNEPYYTDNQNKMANKDLGWERTTQFNIGVDFNLYKGKIGGTIDFYHSNTTDLLMAMKIPALTGYPSIMANVGETKNNGIDITINATPVEIGDFAWNTSLNAAWQKDEIVELSNGKEDDIANAWFIGESIEVFYGYANAGLWQESDAAEIAKFAENKYNFKPGDVRPVDQNGDYKIDENDRVILGNKNPRWTLGWTNTFSWKGLELTVDMWGRFKYMVDTGGEGQIINTAQRDIDYWTPNNTGADWQRPVAKEKTNGDNYGLLGFKDASFIKLRNLSLGYRFDKSITDAMKIEGLKVYVQGKNLGRIYSSVDFMDLDMGTSYYNRGVTFGVQVDF